MVMVVKMSPMSTRFQLCGPTIFRLSFEWLLSDLLSKDFIFIFFANARVGTFNSLIKT